MEPEELIWLLKNINPLSVWGRAIHIHLETATPESLDELVLEIRSQANDNPQMMREILGSTIYDKLIIR